MNYDRGSASQQLTRALVELAGEDSQAQRLLKALGNLRWFTAEEHRVDLRPQARYFLEQLLTISRDRLEGASREDLFNISRVLVDFLIFAKEDLVIAEQRLLSVS